MFGVGCEGLGVKGSGVRVGVLRFGLGCVRVRVLRLGRQGWGVRATVVGLDVRVRL